MVANQLERVLKNELNLIYSSDQQPGYTRKNTGAKFVYLNEKSEELRSPKIIEHIENLVIPPMWEDVWICKTPKGHLQSTGRDAKRRKQYVYHPEWTNYRQQMKFNKMIPFVDALPTMRKTIDAHIKNKVWNREKTMALIVKILDNHHIRIGNKQYAQRNETYGLTTLRRKHLTFENGLLNFSYKAKSNKYRKISLDNRKLAKLVKECSELRGYEVFRYQDENGQLRTVDSGDVNEYIQEIMGDDFTAKDFRTWAGTSLAVDFYADATTIIEENPRKKIEPTLVKMVADELGNTMSVCRTYYIHPKILNLIEQGELPLKTRKKIDGLEPCEVIAKQILMA